MASPRQARRGTNKDIRPKDIFEMGFTENAVPEMEGLSVAVQNQIRLVAFWYLSG